MFPINSIHDYKYTHGTALQKCNHTPTEETRWMPHPEEITIFCLCENTKVDCCDILVSCVYNGGAVLHEFESGKLLQCLFTKFVFDLLFGPLAFLLDVETAEVDMILCLPAGEPSDTDED